MSARARRRCRRRRWRARAPRSISWSRSTMGASFLRAFGSTHRPGREAAHEAPHEGVRLRARELLRLGAGDPGALLGAAVVITGDDVLGDVHEATRQVARVGGAQGRVGEALAGAVRGDEVLQDGHALAEVGAHGHVDDAAGGVGHEAAHAAQLADVALVAAGARRRSSSSPSPRGRAPSIMRGPSSWTCPGGGPSRRSRRWCSAPPR